MRIVETCGYCIHREVCYVRKAVLDAVRLVSLEHLDQTFPEKDVWEKYLGEACIKLRLDD